MEFYARRFDLEGIEVIRAGKGGDGRTVEAYAAVFDTPAEIRDGQGHYLERIAKSAFNRQLGMGIQRVQVFYNHALDAFGSPAQGIGAVPIGRPVSITADGRGLRTVTRYNEGEFADTILEAIRNQAITGYSFRGRIFKSDPARPPRARAGAALPVVTRLELGLAEYGPTPSPAYQEAAVLAMRAALAAFSPDGAHDGPQDEEPTAPGTELGAGTGDQLTDDVERSRRAHLQRLRMAARDRKV